MEVGFATALGLLSGTPWEPLLLFVVSGAPTATNPLTAFKQGIQDVPQNEAYLLRGRRCAACGVVELVATERTNWPP